MCIRDRYTGVKNLEILADMKRMISKADIRLILKKVGLDPDMKKPVGKYSLGTVSYTHLTYDFIGRGCQEIDSSKRGRV